MINREVIRIKVLQMTYAYYVNCSRNIDAAEKELLLSLSKTYDLYNCMLTLITAITEYVRHMLDLEADKEDAKELVATLSKFVNNRFAMQLEGNTMLNDYLESHGNLWEDNHREFVAALSRQITTSEFYKEYIENGEDSYESDRDLWRKIYRTLIQQNDEIDAILEEESIYWNDDKDIVDTFVLKTIKRFEEKNKSHQQLLPEYDTDEEKDFARRLFRTSILNADEYQKYMSEVSHNWELRRLAFMDLIIMQLAIAEMVTFPNIPISVTINEYVDLAKVYSTSKSGAYVNGMLDAIAHNLIEAGKLTKFMNERKDKDKQLDNNLNN